MPGIVGLFTKMPREVAEAELFRMVETLRHEAFYVAGTWVDEELGIYVGWIVRKNYFSAEAKALLAVRPELRKTDPRGLGESISCGCVLENRTIFKGIHVLPAASTWEFRRGALHRKSTYFQPQDWENQDPLEPEAYY